MVVTELAVGVERRDDQVSCCQEDDSRNTGHKAGMISRSVNLRENLWRTGNDPARTTCETEKRLILSEAGSIIALHPVLCYDRLLTRG